MQPRQSGQAGGGSGWPPGRGAGRRHTAPSRPSNPTGNIVRWGPGQGVFKVKYKKVSLNGRYHGSMVRRGCGESLCESTQI